MYRRVNNMVNMDHFLSGLVPIFEEPKDTFRFIEKVLNGSKHIFLCSDTGQFYRTLNGARNRLKSDMIRKPKNINHRYSYVSGGKWRKKTADEMMQESMKGGE